MAKTDKPQRVVIVADVSGTGPYYHLGDEAMAFVAIERLKRIVGGENLVLFCPRPKTAASTYGIKAVKMPTHTRWNRLSSFLFRPFHSCKRYGILLWHLWRAKALFFAGGGNLTNIYQGALVARLFILRAAKAFHRHIFLVSQTIGPLHPADRERCHRLMAGIDWLGVRDPDFSSRQINLPAKFAPDDAVFIEPHKDSAIEQLAGRPGRSVGLSFHLHRGIDPAAYAPLFTVAERVVLHFKASGVFVPHLIGPNGDLEMAARLKNTWHAAELVIVENVPRPAAVIALNSSFYLVLATRYHSVVFALTAGVPVVGIYFDSYTEAKMRGAFAQFGLAPYVVALEKIEDLTVVSEKVVEAAELFREAASRVKREQAAANMAPYEVLASLLR